MTSRFIPKQEYERNTSAVAYILVVSQINEILDADADQYVNEVTPSGVDYLRDQKLQASSEFSDAPIVDVDTATHLLPVDIHRAFLESVYDCSKPDRIKTGILLVFRRLNDLLLNERFADCDELMSIVNFDRLPVDLILSFFTITWAAREELPSRRSLLETAKQRICAIRDSETADQLLDKLR